MPQTLISFLHRSQCILLATLMLTLFNTLTLTGPVQAQTEEELDVATERLIKKLVEMRGWEFKKAVPRKMFTEEQLLKMLEKEINEEMPQELIDKKSNTLKVLGLVPQDLDIMAHFKNLLKDNVAGFYQPKNGTIHLMKRDGETKMPQVMSDTVIIHELTHALDDQYFDLAAMQEAAGTDEDSNQAITSVIEGSATVLMTRFMIMASMDPNNPVDTNELQKATKEEAERAKGMLEGPKYFLCSFIPPYVNGMNFVLEGKHPAWLAAQVNQSMAKNVIITMQHPPTSMEQVLHPAKYWNPERFDPPVKVIDDEFIIRFDQAGLQVLATDTIGQMGITGMNWPKAKKVEYGKIGQASFFISRSGAGWGGDRFFLLAPKDMEKPFENPEKLMGVWVTNWDTERDRKEFYETLTEHGPGKHNADQSLILGKNTLVLFYNINNEIAKTLSHEFKENSISLLKGNYKWDTEKTLTHFEMRADIGLERLKNIDPRQEPISLENATTQPGSTTQPAG